MYGFLLRFAMRGYVCPLPLLSPRLLILMTDSEADYTFLWRQLADLPATGRTGEEPAASLVAGGPLGRHTAPHLPPALRFATQYRQKNTFVAGSFCFT